MNIPQELYELIGKTINVLGGWTSPERAGEMADLIVEVKPELCVELGVFAGRSLIAQAMALKHLGSGHIVGIDPWRVDPCLEGENEANRNWWSGSVDLESIYRECMNAIWANKLEPFCSVLRNTSQNTCQLFDCNAIDVLNIDANHSEVASCRDVEMWLPRVRTGGIVMCDDLDWPSTQKAKQMLFERCELVKDGGTYGFFRKKASEAA